MNAELPLEESLDWLARGAEHAEDETFHGQDWDDVWCHTFYVADPGDIADRANAFLGRFFKDAFTSANGGIDNLLHDCVRTAAFAGHEAGVRQVLTLLGLPPEAFNETEGENMAGLWDFIHWDDAAGFQAFIRKRLPLLGQNGGSAP